MVGEILEEYFWVYMAKLENLHFANNTQNYSAKILTTMNPPEAILDFVGVEALQVVGVRKTSTKFVHRCVRLNRIKIC